MNLAKAKTNEIFFIKKISRPNVEKNLFNHLIYKGQKIQVSDINFDKNTIAIKILQQKIALRMFDAQKIEVEYAK